MKYILWNETDGCQADFRAFSTTKQARAAKAEFIARFKLQGYYKTSRGERIPASNVMLKVMPKGAI